MLTEQASKVHAGLVRLRTGRADETRSDQLADRARLVMDAVKALEAPTGYLAIAAARGIPTDRDRQARANAAAGLATPAIQALVVDDTGEELLGAALNDALALVKQVVTAREELASDSWATYATGSRWASQQDVMGTLAGLDTTDSELVLIARRLHHLATKLVEAGDLSYPKRRDRIETFDKDAEEFERLFASIGGDEAVPPDVLAFIQAASGRGATFDEALAVSDWLREHDLLRRFVVSLAR